MRIKYAFVAVAVVFILLLALSIQRAHFKPGSHLGLFEQRLDGPLDAMMRHSPELRANFNAFEECEKHPKCNHAAIIAERDTIVKRIWPDVFNQLLVSTDWGSYSQSKGSHELFDQARTKVGDYRLRYACVPEVIYRFDRSVPQTFYTSLGYVCDGKNISFSEYE